MLLAVGVLCAVYFLPFTPIDTILAASLADGPTAGPAGFIGADKGAYEYEADGDGTAARQTLETRLVETALSNHDSDGDGLIQITTVEQLNAVRYDLDGDGAVEDDDSTEGVDEASLYSAVFPVASDGSVCPVGTSCTGYELMNDLDLDTDGDGTADDGDTYWNDGAGWQPIGMLNSGFAATFEGNGMSINNLFIDRSTEDHIGLFGLVGDAAEIRNIALVDLSVTGSRYVGGLAGQLKESTVSGASTAGTVAGNRGRIGGLVGDGQNSIIENSKSSANVTAMGSSGRAGGLVGELQQTGSEGGVTSVVRRSYATGRVSSNQTRIGGLVGNLHQQSTPAALVVASYATGAVSGSGSVGGLVGRSGGEVRASYATGAVTGNNKTGGLVGDNRGTVTASYFDTSTSDQTHATQGKTTAELQSPTGYEAPTNGIYAQWNIDLDVDGAEDDPWDFGAGSQYPALKVDGLDDDTTATWQEFGSQFRSRLVVAVNATATSVTLSWTAPASTDYPGAPAITYQVYRDGVAIGAAQAGLTYTDEGLTRGFTHVYRVDVLLDGEPVRGSNAALAPPALSISIADAEAVEGGNVTFTVTKTGAGAVSLNWTASIEDSDTAVIADLGSAASGTVDFAASDTSKTFTVATAQDSLDEGAEVFTVTLIATSGMPNLADGTASGTITDDDRAPGAPTGLMASTSSGRGEIDLEWTAPSDTGVLNGADPAAITGYQYRRAESSAGLVAANWDSAGNTTTFTVTGLTGGTTYQFQVRALNGVTPGGAASNEDSATTRALSSDASLSSLVISQGTLSPEFAAAKTTYTATVGNGVGSLDVTPTAANSNATIAANESGVTSGSPSEAIALTVGANTIQVVVTAEDGTKATYTITVTRSGPSISVADAEVAEGGNVTFTISKVGVGAVALNWTASIEESDTAAVADLGATTSGIVTITASDSSKTFTVETRQDTVDEAGETFTVTLTATSGMPNVTDGTATGTITDDDESAGAPTGLSASTGSGVGEIDLEWTAPSYPGVLNGTDPAAVTGYQYRRAESSAGLDSVAWQNAGAVSNRTVTGLTAGATYYFQVRALNGVTPEGAASNEAGATAKAHSSNATLSALIVSEWTLSPGFTPEETDYNVTVANRVTVVTVTPTGADGDAAIAVNGAAVISGSPSGPISLRVGTNVISVVVTAEDGTEKKYTITVRRPAAPSYFADLPDPPVVVAIADASGKEGGDITFTIKKRGTAAVSLNWTLSIEESDTVRAEDLGPVNSGTMAFKSSETIKTFTVATVQDTLDEDDETFTVAVTATSGTVEVADGTATGTITDDDQAAGAPIGLIASMGAGEGEIELSWNKPPDAGVLDGMNPAAITGYQYRMAESSAGLQSALWTTAGTATNLTVAGLQGGLTYYFQARALNGVTPKGDPSDEASATAKKLPAISIDDATGAEGSGVSFTLSKTGAGAVTLDWTASVGKSDTADVVDLGATILGTVDFADSDTNKTFTVATVQDSLDESAETFTVTVTAPPGAANVADGTATGTIADDDESAGAPTGLTAAPGGREGEIDLSWTVPHETGVLNGADPAVVTSYQYRLAAAMADLALAAWTNAGVATQVTVTGLTGGTTYYFQVRALNGVTPEGEGSAEAAGAPGNRALNAVTETRTPGPTLTPMPDEEADGAGGAANVPDAQDDLQPPSGADGEPEQTPAPTPAPTLSITPTPGPTFAQSQTPQPIVAPTSATLPTPQSTVVPTAAPPSKPDSLLEPAPTPHPSAEAGPTATIAPTALPSPTVGLVQNPAESGSAGDRKLPVPGWLLIGMAVLLIAAAGVYALRSRRDR